MVPGLSGYVPPDFIIDYCQRGTGDPYPRQRYAADPRKWSLADEHARMRNERARMFDIRNRRDARRQEALDRSRVPGYAQRIRDSGPGWAKTPRRCERVVTAPEDAPARAPERKARSRLE